MSVMQAKVPAIVATGIICLLVGGGLGAAIMSYSAGKPEQAQAASGDENANAKGGPPGAGGKGPDAKKGGKGGGKGATPQIQLTQLVGKLDTLTKQTLHVELTPEQKKQIKEQLAGLEDKEAITEEEATAKRDAILKLLEAQRPMFEAAGYNWPGTALAPMPKEVGMPPAPGAPPAPGGAPPAPPPSQNPFKAGPGADHLKSLRGLLG